VLCHPHPRSHPHTLTHAHNANKKIKPNTIKKSNKKNYSASELRSLLGGLGPSFVKIGQALSARPDLLPAPYLRALSDLQVSW
jgi:predicted unusual protein kinase regulating ubiquinone biosynthesis (AarF/ABC1/UbiB family)